MIVDSSKLAESLQKILKKYGEDVTEVVRRSVKKTGNYARDRLKQVSPRNTHRQEDERKRYASGWKASEYTWTALGAQVTVHNETKPGLAHLLENGHIMRNGLRSPKYPHIAPVEKEAQTELEKTIRTAIAHV